MALHEVSACLTGLTNPIRFNHKKTPESIGNKNYIYQPISGRVGLRDISSFDNEKPIAHLKSNMNTVRDRSGPSWKG